MHRFRVPPALSESYQKQLRDALDGVNYQPANGLDHYPNNSWAAGPQHGRERGVGQGMDYDTSVSHTGHYGKWEQMLVCPQPHAMPSYQHERYYSGPVYGRDHGGQPIRSPSKPTFGAPSDAPRGQEYSYHGANNTVDGYRHPPPELSREYRGNLGHPSAGLYERSSHRKVHRNLWSGDCELRRYGVVDTSRDPPSGSLRYPYHEHQARIGPDIHGGVGYSLMPPPPVKGRAQADRDSTPSSPTQGVSYRGARLAPPIAASHQQDINVGFSARDIALRQAAVKAANERKSRSENKDLSLGQHDIDADNLEKNN